MNLLLYYLLNGGDILYILLTIAMELVIIIVALFLLLKIVQLIYFNFLKNINWFVISLFILIISLLIYYKNETTDAKMIFKNNLVNYYFSFIDLGFAGFLCALASVILWSIILIDIYHVINYNEEKSLFILFGAIFCMFLSVNHQINLHN